MWHNEKSPTVLVVDDETALVELVRVRLELAGFRTLWAYRAQDAIDHLSTMDIAAAVLDVNMPGMDGFEILTWMQRHPRTAKIPVLMLTGRKGGEDVARAIKLGAKDYLTKPFSEEALIQRVQRLMRWVGRTTSS